VEILQSAEVGRVAGSNPWRSHSPEWQIPSPIPEHSFARPLAVVGEPYDYGLPGSSYVNMVPVAGDDYSVFAQAQRSTKGLPVDWIVR
jgi:cytochrome c oxidase subunit 1